MKIRKNIIAIVGLILLTSFITIIPMVMNTGNKMLSQPITYDVISYPMLDTLEFHNELQEIDEEMVKTNDLLFLLEAKNDDGFYKVDSIVIK